MIYTNENWKPPVTYCEPNKVEVQRMTREEAVDTLKAMQALQEIYRNEAVDMAIEALSAETPTIQEKHQLSEVDTPTVFIDGIGHFPKLTSVVDDTREALDKELEGYVSAEALQAESVIRCKECKYWNSKTDLTHCYRLAWVGTEKDDYCSFAERREP